jgi:hypothetical protein
LRVIAAGCWLGLVYCACKLIGFAFSWAGRDLHWLSNGVAPMSASVAALLVLAGFALPAIGPRGSAWRRLRRLRPLWRTVTAGAPDVVMEGSGWSVWWPFADLEWRANRRMAEIRDVQRAVRCHVEADALDMAREKAAEAGLDEQRRAAVTEAVGLRRGLQNQAVGHVPARSATSIVVATGAEPAAEHEHLALVADVYRLPLVDAVLDELRERSAAQRL